MRENVSLKPYNTFGLEAKARFFQEINTKEELLAIMATELFRSKPLLILGGGSNVLFTQDFDGLVLLNNLKGIRVVEEDAESVLLECASGENWHEMVLFTVDSGWHGIENLSLIPGTVGAAPMQNIGAYGVEIKEVMELVTYINLETGKEESLKAEACEFGYRESIFKHRLKGKVFILSIRIRLKKTGYAPKISYGDIQSVLADMNINSPTVKDVSDAVIAIRSSKLPDPKELGNSGSFFKNPEISIAQLNELKVQFPLIPSYPTREGFAKVPAGWLIENAGWKGRRVGNTGSHAKQALVLVNYGEANGQEVLNLAQAIIEDVEAKYGIRLVPEVNIL